MDDLHLRKTETFWVLLKRCQTCFHSLPLSRSPSSEGSSACSIPKTDWWYFLIHVVFSILVRAKNRIKIISTIKIGLLKVNLILQNNKNLLSYAFKIEVIKPLVFEFSITKILSKNSYFAIISKHLFLDFCINAQIWKLRKTGSVGRIYPNKVVSTLKSEKKLSWQRHNVKLGQLSRYC